MKRLYVDDVRIPSFDATVVRDPFEAIQYLDEHWDEVWFDFDMGGLFLSYEQAQEQLTILPFLDAIMERCFNGDEPDIDVCVLHTANPYGRQILELALQQHYPIRHVNARDYCAGTIVDDYEDYRF